MNLQTVDPLTRVVAPRYYLLTRDRDHNLTPTVFQPTFAHLYTVPITVDPTVDNITIVNGGIAYNPDSLTASASDIVNLWDSLIPAASDITPPTITVPTVQDILRDNTFTVAADPVQAYAQILALKTVITGATPAEALTLFGILPMAYSSANLPDLALLAARFCIPIFTMDRPSYVFAEDIQPVVELLQPALVASGVADAIFA